MRRILKAAALLCALVAPAAALDPARAISQYQKRNWQVEHGLPRNYVMSVQVAADGYMLVGTDEGLARFDGVRFTPFDLTPSLRLSRRWIGKLLAARSGSLWISTFDGWIYEYRDGSVRTSFNAGATVFTLLEDAHGVMWASTRNGVLRQEGGSFARVPELARPPETAWNVLALDGNGAVWAVTIDGLFRVRNGAITKVAAAQAGVSDILTAVPRRQGGLWVGTSKGLFRLTESSNAVKLEQQAGVPGLVVSILEDRDGVTWAGAWGRGIFRVRGTQVDEWSAREGLPDEFVRTMYEDPEGNLWVGTRGGGLVRCKDTPVVPYGVPEGLGGDYATTVALAPDGHLWFGTWRGGLYRFDNGSFIPQPTPVPAVYCSIRALAIDRAGHQWIGNWEGLFGFDGKRYRNFAEAGSPYHIVSAILFDRRGRLWVATSNNGVFLFASGDPVRPAASYLPGADITSLYEDSQGRVWYGTPQGLGYFDSGDHPELHALNGAAVDSVSSVTEDVRGRIWAASFNGSLYVVTPSGTRLIGIRDGLQGVQLYRLIDDAAGSLWVSSPKGILRLRSEQVDELLAGKRRRLDIQTYDGEDGMRTIECQRVSQPAGWTDPHGGVWFPTTRGFVHVAARRGGEPAAPQVRLEESSVDGRALAAGVPIVLAPGAHALEIHYTGLRFTWPGKIHFRYRLQGFDPDWVDAGTQRVARYSGVPPGKYQFLVAAGTPGGGWTAQPAAISVTQRPQFHQTPWFLVLLTVALMGVAVALFRWRVHIIKGRYAVVLAERARIAREWHDTLLAGFAAISWQLEETLSRLKEKPDQAHSTVDLALRMVRHYRDEARRVIWDLRESRSESETLGDAITGSLHQLTDGTAIEGRVDVSGTVVSLDHELERNVLRICQEAASNAKRHASPRTILIELAYEPGTLRARIRDDGKGFAPSEVMGLTSGHFGLAVMKERAERFRGTLRVASEPGRGTLIEASIPFGAAVPR